MHSDTLKAKFHYAICFEPDSVMEFGFYHNPKP